MGVLREFLEKSTIHGLFYISSTKVGVQAYISEGFDVANRKGWLGIANLKKIYKDRLDLGLTWLKWLPHSMEQYGRLAPKSNKVNYQKLTLYFKKIHR